MRTRRKEERRGHEGEEKDEKSKERGAPTRGIESGGVVSRGDPEEAHDEKKSAPDVPAIPETGEPEEDDADGKEERHVTVQAGADRPENMSAVQLGNRHEIQRGHK